MTTKISKRTFYLFFVPIFVCGMMIVPWPSIVRDIYGHEFIDRSIYTNYFLYGQSILESREFDSLWLYIINEFLWHFSVRFAIDNLNISIESIFGFISISCLTVFAVLIVRKHNPLALLLLINPLVVDLAFSQLRMALAISLLGLAYMLQERHRFVVMGLVLLSLLIHTASFIFLAIYLAIRIADKVSSKFREGPWLKYVMLFAVGASISIALGPLREAILSAIGDRRAVYPDMGSTLQYTSFWIFLLAAFPIRANRLLKHEYQQYAAVILSIVSINVFHGGYSTRFLAAAFPLLVSSVLSFRGVIGIAMLLAFLIYAALQWAYWLRIV